MSSINAGGVIPVGFDPVKPWLGWPPPEGTRHFLDASELRSLRLVEIGRRVVNGDNWIRDRLTFLRDQLAHDALSDEQRTAVQAEIDALSAEAGITVAGHRTGWLRRRARRNS